MTGFPDGFSIEHDGQTYRPLRLRHHVNRFDAPVTLIDWLTACPSCGSEFEITTTLQWSTGRLRRRCDACKAPGRRVRVERRDRAHDLAVSSQGDWPPAD